MPRPRISDNDRQQRALVAAAAARLIAEDGVRDYALATRKAADSLGVMAGVALPDAAEVEAELRTYQRLFQADEHAERIDRLRRTALAMMTRVERFRPYLAGSVLDGSAGRFAEIDIQLFAESSKEVEIFLLNEKIDFDHSVPRAKRAEAVLSVQDEEALINLIVYPLDMERVSFKGRDGQPRERANLRELRKLVAAAAP